ncbi:MAG: thermonuclease family protein [Cyanobacteriota bacterium]
MASGAVALGGTALAATVVAVDSGDTLRVREGGQVRQIRLACLEAPALSQAPHGEQARATLRRLLPEGSAVLLRPISRAGDPSGVPVVEVSTRSGSVNIELVRAGQAFTTLDTQPQCDALRYAEAENTARFQRLGVWRVEGGYAQCLATAREKFLEGSRGNAPPAGLLEGFCSCLIQPKASDSPASLGQRCTRQLLDRISRIASPG